MGIQFHVEDNPFAQGMILILKGDIIKQADAARTAQLG